jgi:hypothetical protein
MRIRSTLGRGTVVVLRLPINGRAPAPDESAAAAA